MSIRESDMPEESEWSTFFHARACSQSPVVTVVARIRISTSLSLGVGVSISWSCSTSEGP